MRLAARLLPPDVVSVGRRPPVAQGGPRAKLDGYRLSGFWHHFRPCGIRDTNASLQIANVRTRASTVQEEPHFVALLAQGQRRAARPHCSALARTALSPGNVASLPTAAVAAIGWRALPVSFSTPRVSDGHADHIPRNHDPRGPGERLRRIPALLGAESVKVVAEKVRVSQQWMMPPGTAGRGRHGAAGRLRRSGAGHGRGSWPGPVLHLRSECPYTGARSWNVGGAASFLVLAVAALNRGTRVPQPLVMTLLEAPSPVASDEGVRVRVERSGSARGASADDERARWLTDVRGEPIALAGCGVSDAGLAERGRRCGPGGVASAEPRDTATSTISRLAHDGGRARVL